MTAEVAGGHVGIGVDAWLLAKPLALHLASLLHPSTDDTTGLPERLPHELTIGDGGDLEMNIDSIEQRPRYSGAVAFDSEWAAAAGMQWVPRVSAWTGVHRCREHE